MSIPKSRAAEGWDRSAAFWDAEADFHLAMRRRYRNSPHELAPRIAENARKLAEACIEKKLECEDAAEEARRFHFNNLRERKAARQEEGLQGAESSETTFGELIS